MSEHFNYTLNGFRSSNIKQFDNNNSTPNRFDLGQRQTEIVTYFRNQIEYSDYELICGTTHVFTGGGTGSL